MSADYRTPLKRIRFFGSAHHGVEHFIAQKSSAIALAVLAPLFLGGIALSAMAGPVALSDWLASPFGALVSIGFFGVATFHMRLGMQVVIEDYVQSTGLRYAALMANSFFTLALWVCVVFSILYLVFGG